MKLSGFTEIDDQHLQLLDTLASARSWIAEGKEFIALLTLLGRLEDYALHHFHDEEKLMVKYKYFDYDRHRQEHEWFRDYIHEQLARLTTTGEPDHALLTFVENWFVKHIEVEAELFRQHFK